MKFNACYFYSVVGYSGYDKVSLCNRGQVDLPSSIAFSGFSFIIDRYGEGPVEEELLLITSCNYFSSLSLEQM
jgi:hypothetical protein